MSKQIPEVMFPEARLLLAKHFLESAKMLGNALFPGKVDQLQMWDMLIVTAIFIGHAEGRCPTASDISVMIDIPRSTVIRRMKSLVQICPIKTIRTGNRVCYFFNEVNSEQIIKSFAMRVRRIRELNEQLSNLDTKLLDDLVNNDYK